MEVGHGVEQCWVASSPGGGGGGAKKKLSYLIAAHVGVAHEVEHQMVGGQLGGRLEGQFHLGSALQGDALDGQQRVGLGVPHHQPPLLLLAGRVPANSGHRSGL